jgi:hypothetical protein
MAKFLLGRSTISKWGTHLKAASPVDHIQISKCKEADEFIAYFTS